MSKKYWIFVGLGVLGIAGVLAFGIIGNQTASIRGVSIGGLSPMSTSQPDSVTVKPADYDMTARKGWEMRRVSTKVNISESGEWTYACNLWWYNTKTGATEYIGPCGS
jgi:hypothetical protein